jgi:Eukaryotic aspartyl protease
MRHASRHVPRRPRGTVKRRFAADALPRTSVAAPQSLRIPITNVYGGGDYTAALRVGSHGATANVIIDTGSSTLAVTPNIYDPSKDLAAKASSLAQVVIYGTGGWGGPVLQAPVVLGNASLPAAPLALSIVQEPNNFGNADGILGLAYNALNDAFDSTTALKAKNVIPPNTFPWPFKVPGSSAGLNELEQLLGKARRAVSPYFTALEQSGVVANKLAFYTLRSFPHMASANATVESLIQDRLNQGLLIVGGGEEQTDLYVGSFQDVAVVDDLYYNVTLKAVQVGNRPAVAAAPIQPRFAAEAGSNAIVDSGTNSLALANDVFTAIVKDLQAINPKFVQQLQQASESENGIPTAQLHLETWPVLTFILQGETGDVPLIVQPACYWQVDSPAPGQASPVIEGQGGGAGIPTQSILGLPLMNGYYTVFDRSADANGLIRFATVKV